MSVKLTILTHDARWKGLAPTVKRASEAAVLEIEARSVVPLPLRERLGEGTLKLSASLSAPLTLTLSRKGRGNTQYVAPTRLSVTIVLTDDAEIQALNAQYRGKNKPTNVLSFPDGSEEIGRNGKPFMHLGDIAMAYETIAGEAAAQGKALKHHIAHLSIHGVLHLLGYDHEEAGEAETMEALEIAILACMGIANPYESD